MPDGKWRLHFAESEPKINQTFEMQDLYSWTELMNGTLKINCVTGIYENTYTFEKLDPQSQYMLLLGDVRESAKVFVNEHMQAQRGQFLLS